MNSLPTHPVPPNPDEAGHKHPSPRPSKAKTGGRGKILLVDDDPQVGKVLCTWLRKIGYQVTFASNPDEADKLLASSPFELVLSDVNMPGNFRLEWVEGLLNRGSSPPILLITGTPVLATACRAANLPVAGYLLKPLDFTTLGDVIQRVVQEHRRRGEFTSVAQDIIHLLTARNIESTPEESALVGRLAQLYASFRSHPERIAADPPADEAWRSAITDAIGVIEKTKHSFRSRELGDLRQRLLHLVRSEGS